MVAQFLASLEPSISPARLQRYQSATGDPLDTVVNYHWNMALCEALYCSLSAVEIALRNGLHTTLATHFSTPAWYDEPGALEPFQITQVAQAKDKIRGYRKPVTPDRVVSQLEFGFWVTILSRPYDARIWAQQPTTLRSAFLRLARRFRQRQPIHQHYNEIRKLRNRAFHHEPHFDDIDLMVRYGNIKKGLHWLNPDMVDCFEFFDLFPDIHRNGRAQVEATVKNHLGIP